MKHERSMLATQNPKSESGHDCWLHRKQLDTTVRRSLTVSKTQQQYLADALTCSMDTSLMQNKALACDHMAERHSNAWTGLADQHCRSDEQAMHNNRAICCAGKVNALAAEQGVLVLQLSTLRISGHTLNPSLERPPATHSPVISQ